MSPHGTRSRYLNGACRCEPCGEANKEYFRHRTKETCVDCGGPRSFGSSERCRACYQGHDNGLTRNAKGQWANSRYPDVEEVQAMCDTRDSVVTEESSLQPELESSESVFGGLSGPTRQGKEQKFSWKTV